MKLLDSLKKTLFAAEEQRLKEKEKELEEEYWNKEKALLKSSELRFLNERQLGDLLFRTLFSEEFEDADFKRRFQALQHMSRYDIILAYFRSRYTRVYQSAVFNRNQDSSDYMKGVFAGRVIELLNLLQEINLAKSVNLEDYLEYQQTIEKKRQHFGLDRTKKISAYLINNKM